MKWGEDPDPEDADEDDTAEFDKMRKVSSCSCESVSSAEY